MSVYKCGYCHDSASRKNSDEIFGVSLRDPFISELALHFYSVSYYYSMYIVPKLCTIFYICGFAINFIEHVHVRIVLIYIVGSSNFSTTRLQ